MAGIQGDSRAMVGSMFMVYGKVNIGSCSKFGYVVLVGIGTYSRGLVLSFSFLQCCRLCQKVVATLIF